MPSTSTDRRITADLTLRDIVARRAGARKVLLDRGLDLCCGGDLPLAEAARLHGLDLAELLDALAPDHGA